MDNITDLERRLEEAERTKRDAALAAKQLRGQIKWRAKHLNAAKARVFDVIHDQWSEEQRAHLDRLVEEALDAIRDEGLRRTQQARDAAADQSAEQRSDDWADDAAESSGAVAGEMAGDWGDDSEAV